MRGVLLAALLAATPLAGGCAARQAEVDALPRGARGRWRRCRPHVTASLCPDGEPSCIERVGAWYAGEPLETRADWLAAHGCPDAVIRGKR